MNLEDYNSHNTNRLDLNATKQILLRLSTLRDIVDSGNFNITFEGE